MQGNEDLNFNFLHAAHMPSEPPGEIDNYDIIDEALSCSNITDPDRPSFHYTLKQGLAEDTDFHLVPEEAFKVLEGRYGARNDVQRHVIEVNEAMY